MGFFYPKEGEVVRLYRSQQDQRLGGVCAGLGHYLGIDATWIRLIFILLALGGGSGLLIYFILWVVVPEEGQEGLPPSETVRNGVDQIAERARLFGRSLESGEHRERTAQLMGMGLIVLGAYLALRSLNLIWFRWFRFEMLWPLVLVGIGALLLVRPGTWSPRGKGQEEHQPGGEQKGKGSSSSPVITRHYRLRSGVVWPLTLVLAGTLFLLSNFGLVGDGFWSALWRLWPVWLIALGVEVLFGRRSYVGPILAAALIFGVVGGAAYFIPPGGQHDLVSTGRFSQKLDGATKADVTVKVGVARLRIEALGTPDLLAEGALRVGDRERVEHSFRRSGDTAYLELEHKSTPFIGLGGQGSRKWDLRLNPALPMRLTVHSGISESMLDLSAMQVHELKVNAGIGQTTVILPATGQVRAEIEGGIGQTIVRIPQGMEAQIRIETGIGGASLTDDFRKDGSIWGSHGYPTAEHRVDLVVKGGIGQVLVRRH